MFPHPSNGIGKAAFNSETASRFRQRLQSPIEERLGVAASTGHTRGARFRLLRNTHEQPGQRSVDTIAHKRRTLTEYSFFQMGSTGDITSGRASPGQRLPGINTE